MSSAFLGVGLMRCSEWKMPAGVMPYRPGTYGHTVEHTAENLLVCVLFFSVASSAVAGALASVKLRRH